MDKVFGIIMGAGAFGGILYWLIAQLTGTPVFAAWPTIGQLFGLAVLGAGAALVGVYVLTASDLKQTKTYVFAMLCGMAFQPIFKAGTNLAGNLDVKQRTAELKQGTANL